jgi:hypothetical protein
MLIFMIWNYCTVFLFLSSYLYPAQQSLKHGLLVPLLPLASTILPCQGFSKPLTHLPAPLLSTWVPPYTLTKALSKILGLAAPLGEEVWDRISCSPGWSWTHNFPASAFQMLELQSSLWAVINTVLNHAQYLFGI